MPVPILATPGNAGEGLRPSLAPPRARGDLTILTNSGARRTRKIGVSRASGLQLSNFLFLFNYESGGNMTRTTSHQARKTEALLAAGMLLSFFAPWLYSLGAPIRAHEIRERLAGPHKLLSVFTADSRISENYRMSIFLYAVPLASALVLILIGMRRYRPWIGALAGASGVAAFLFLRGEVAALPFHRLAWGAYAAMGAGAGLLAAPAVKSFRK